MIKKSYIFFLLPSLLFAKSINYEQALNLTLENSNLIKNQKLNYEKARLDTKSIEAFNYGEVNLISETSKTNHAGYVFNAKLSSREASFNDFGANDFIKYGSNYIPDNLNKPSSRTNITTKITYDIPLFTGFKLSKQKEISSLLQKANTITLKKTKKDIALEVLEAYNSAVVAKDYIKALKNSKKAIEAIVLMSKEFNKEGLVTKIDVKQSKLYLYEINSKLLEIQNSYKLALTYLRFLTKDETISEVQNLKNIRLKKNDLAKIYKLALEKKDDLKLQDIQIDIMKKNIDVKNSSYFPTIYSHLEYGVNDDKFTLDDEKDYYMAMIGLKYNLFNNNKNINMQKSKIEYKKSLNNMQRLKDSIKLQTKKSFLEVQNKKVLLEEKTKAYILAKDIFDQAKQMYKNRLINMTNLLQNESNLRLREAQLIEHKFKLSKAYANLANSIGIDFIKKGKK